MADEDPGLRLDYGAASLRLRGLAVLGTLAVLAITGSNLYAGYRIEAAIASTRALAFTEHLRLLAAQDRTSCILTMTQEDRTQFRLNYRGGAFEQVCPWLAEPGPGR